MPDPSHTLGYLIDSNVLIDIHTEDPSWYAWSSSALAGAARRSGIYVNPLIYAEVSTRFASIDELEAALPSSIFRRAALPYSAGFLAAKAFDSYRRNGGMSRTPLPDFYIGAHAVTQGLTLVTRDRRRFATYFPTLRLVAPD